MNTNEFRNELTKIMPGYKWTVKTPYRFKTDTASGYAYMTATGIQTSGFNRMSTLEVTRRVDDKAAVTYETKLAGYGMRSTWRATAKGGTLARALRYMQDYCDVMRSEYAACVRAMETGRKLLSTENVKIPVDNSPSSGV